MAAFELGRKQMDVESRKLGLWSGPLEDLELLAVPAPETIDRFENGFHSAGLRLQTVMDKIRQCEERKKDLDGKIDGLDLSYIAFLFGAAVPLP